jgi:hypothetical protein
MVEVWFPVVPAPTGEQLTFAATEIPSRAAMRAAIVQAADMDSAAHIERLEGYVPVF